MDRNRDSDVQIEDREIDTDEGQRDRDDTDE